jgi:hypothetical protein
MARAGNRVYTKMKREVNILEFKRKDPADMGLPAELNNETDNNSRVTQAPDSLNIIDLNSLEAPNKTEWLLEHAMPLNYYTILYGEGGMGKSYVANYIGIQACRGGQTFCGLKFPERPVKTLLLDYELSPIEQKKRLSEICNGLGLSTIPKSFKYAKPKKPIKEVMTNAK